MSWSSQCHGPLRVSCLICRCLTPIYTDGTYTPTHTHINGTQTIRNQWRSVLNGFLHWKKHLKNSKMLLAEQPTFMSGPLGSILAQFLHSSCASRHGSCPPSGHIFWRIAGKRQAWQQLIGDATRPWIKETVVASCRRNNGCEPINMTSQHLKL